MAVMSSVMHAENEEKLIERGAYRRHEFGEHEPHMQIAIGFSRASVTFHVGQCLRQQGYARLSSSAGSPEM
jgi:hypothetical protein